MKEKIIKWGSHRRIQHALFGAPDNRLKRSKFISVYRVSLVKDESISFGHRTVLDPWLGSGTTVKVAEELNRDGIGYEKESQYKAVIMERLGVEPETSAEAATETMAEYADRSLNEDESSAEAESPEKSKPAAIENPDLFDIIRVDEEAVEDEEDKEAIVIEQ